ncbi:MAG: hypothetical protein GTO63_22680 [Anaerolineae bacterium]|nr:hypothetical protein [Anaerolineae bacterium]NIN96107.1 hypothetical protein [Anaerolineae bacterium]NIQ80527.1 hypothetical protein [Anaerolineae bacterium]
MTHIAHILAHAFEGCPGDLFQHSSPVSAEQEARELAYGNQLLREYRAKREAMQTLEQHNMPPEHREMVRRFLGLRKDWMTSD